MQQRLAKAAKALLARNSAISVVVKLHFLRLQDLTTGDPLEAANVMMRTNEECMTRIIQKVANPRQLAFAGMLTRALRIEADDDKYVDATEKIAVEKRYFALRSTALNEAYVIARADPRVLAKQGIVL